MRCGAGRFTGVPVTVSCEWEDLRIMEMNEYIFDIMLRQRLDEIREAAEHSHHVRDTTLAPRPLRVALGQMLVRIGRRLQGLQDHRIARTDAMRTRRAIPPQKGPSCGAVRGCRRHGARGSPARRRCRWRLTTGRTLWQP